MTTPPPAPRPYDPEHDYVEDFTHPPLPEITWTEVPTTAIDWPDGHEPTTPAEIWDWGCWITEMHPADYARFVGPRPDGPPTRLPS